jgi:DNA-binding transcriptional MerR regulator
MSEKLFFKIGEISELLSVTPSQLRYWEQEFNFLKPRKNAKGTRYYSQKDLGHAQLIYYLLKEKGLTINGAKEYLDRKKREGSLEKLEVIATLKKTKNLLEEVKHLLNTKQ